MTEDIYDIENWKKEYPFVERIWKSYEKFDKSVDEDGNKEAYRLQCYVVRKQTEIEEGKYKDFCMKLVRNMGSFAVDHKNVGLDFESCQILNQWVHYMTMKDNIPDKFTKKIFDSSNDKISLMNIERVCPYYSYKEKTNEPFNIIKLFNFSIVVNELVSILKQENHENNCSSWNFVSECTNIYKDMYRDYCSGVNEKYPKKDDTCLRLSTFKTYYDTFISTKPDIKSKLPSLTEGTMNDIIHCESKNSMEVLNNLSPGVQKSDSPINIDTNAVLGTMVGVSSLFSLSYKFTPLGKWFRPRHLIDKVGSNNIGKNAEYELFHNGPENENISFDQTKYNVAYSPV